MKQIITYAYEFGELSPDAQEKAKQWYLNDPFRCHEFSDIANEDVRNVAQPIDAKVQYSLSYCQGDGLNIYGKFDVAPFQSGPERAPLLPWPTYTEKEWRTLKHYGDVCGGFWIPQNRSYCYCMASSIDFSEDWINELKYQYYKNINRNLIERFENDIQVWHTAYCKELEKMGYDFFYEIENDDLKEICDANEWFFDVDGNFMAGV